MHLGRKFEEKPMELVTFRLFFKIPEKFVFFIKMLLIPPFPIEIVGRNRASRG